MLKKYTYGKPFNTEAVTFIPENTIHFNDEYKLPHGTITKQQTENGENVLVLTIPLLPEDRIFGLGETTGGINKRGHIYKSWCTDDPNHTEEKQSLYGAHNFILFHSPEKNEAFALFIDFPGMIIWDAGVTKFDELKITIKGVDADLYLFEPDTKDSEIDSKILLSLIHEFRTIIGKSYIPPLWAMGYMQSRWGYGSESDLDRVYENHKKLGIPLDAIFLDIDYMDEFRDFTVNTKNFPDFPKAIKKMNDKNIHIVPIIDAGIKVDETSDIDNEGVTKDFFCHKKNGALLQAGVWPGLSHFTDFLNPEARKWFGSKYKILTDAGIDGFWNDMNEPAFFYSDDGIKNAYDNISKLISDKNPNVYKTWDVKNEILNVQNSMKDYESFYHRVPAEYAGNLAEKDKSLNDGTALVSHEKVHNLYGYNMTRAASEWFTENIKDKKTLLISRASYIGMHRYSGIWTGDNFAWWSHLKLLLKQLPAINMCGFLYTGCDLGGFCGDTYRELLMRFLGIGVFTPLMRNHSALGTREQEVYQFEKPEDFKAIIQFRYRILPYLWNLINDCAENGKMYFTPLAVMYPNDRIAAEIEDQLMLGDDLMITPVTEANAKGRSVYLPEDMILFTCKKGKGLDTGLPERKEFSKGLHYIEMPADTIAFFMKKGHRIAVAETAENTAKLNMKNLTLWQ